MSYGKIRLSRNDRETIAEMLAARVGGIRERRTVAGSDAERRHYDSVIVEYTAIVDKMATAPAGTVSFAEKELKTLRGALFGAEKPDLMLAWRAALESGDTGAQAGLLAKIEHLEALDPLLAKPFSLDRSQDAEEDEADSEEE